MPRKVIFRILFDVKKYYTEQCPCKSERQLDVTSVEENKSTSHSDK